jgi:tetraacyldisaccharide 4'-kinase
MGTLMDERTIHDILSGNRRGIAPTLLRAALSLASFGYGAAVALRNAAFNHGWRRIHRVPVPVISVGNITTGGTGKTPLVSWLVSELQRRGLHPGILSRGYGSSRPLFPRGGDSENDEARVLALRHPDVPHVQDRDRVAGAHRLLASANAERRTPNADFIILDDAFQHRRLHRDLDIVLIDALQPWGHGRLLPRGLLREPVEALRRADVVVITRADQAEPGELEELRHQLRTIRGVSIDGEIGFRPTRLVNAAGQTRPLSSLSDQSVAAFCGIGNPVGFEQTLRQLGAIGPCRSFPDHHRYTVSDFAALDAWRLSTGADVLLTTLKDLVKAPRTAEHIWAVDIDVHWLKGRDVVESRLASLVGARETRAAA